MATTYNLISSVNLVSAQTSMDFTSIPQTYTDLKLVICGRLSTNDNYYSLKINGSLQTTTNTSLRGSGTAIDAENWSDNYSIVTQRGDATATIFGNAEIYIFNYTGSNNKSISIDSVSENNANFAWTYLAGSLWSSSSAITSLGITNISGGNLAQYSTAHLYGISNA
jgi:hypothetical protein